MLSPHYSNDSEEAFVEKKKYPCNPTEANSTKLGVYSWSYFGLIFKVFPIIEYALSKIKCFLLN